MFIGTRSRLGTFTAMAFDATLTALSEPIHRGSLSNARAALIEGRAEDRAATVGWAHLVDRAPVAPRAVTGAPVRRAG